VSWNERYSAARRTPTNDITYRAQCGTRYGYDLHRKNDEPSCILCQEAVNDYANARNRARGIPEFQAAQCGTNGGYMKHLRNFEPACDECLKAHNDHVTWYNLAAEIRKKILNEVPEA
jgi:hypothetical protein